MGAAESHCTARRAGHAGRDYNTDDNFYDKFASSNNNENLKVKAFLTFELCVEAFVRWAKALGVRETCLFETVDLVELKFLRNVLICLLEVSK